MTGYVRVDTSNNIADGNVISAADLDNEFDGIQAAFNASTGHNHDGTTGEGAPISVLGPTQDVVVGASTVTPKTTNTVDIGSSSLKFKDLFLAGNASIGGTLGVTGATTLSSALTYGGVTLSNAVTGTGNMVLSASPTLTGTLSGANASLSGTLAVTGVATLTAQPILSSLTASRAVFTDGSKGLVSNAITGTGNVVMSASPTLTGTITAEALTTSSTVTLNGGTANGVAYLNGSKVLTTGSALTFDGTTLSNTGSGDRAKFGTGSRNIYIAGDSGGVSMFDGAAQTGNGWYISGASNYVAGYVSSSERIRLTSTGLGIGTSSPATKFVVSNAGALGIEFDPASGAMQVYNRSTSAYGTMNLWANTLYFRTGVSPAINMVLDSSGNLGIGTSSPGYKLTVAGTQRIQKEGAGYEAAMLSFSTLSETGAIYRIGMASGGSLAIGRSDTNTTNLTLDASGNLGIGTSSPGQKLEVVGNILAAASGDTYVASSKSGITTSYLITDSSGANLAVDGVWPIRFTTNGSERARIDSSGRVLVGTTSASGSNLLQVNSDALINGLTVGKGLASLTTNTAFGVSALAAVTTGSGNVALGYQALDANTTGQNNIAIGSSAAGANQTAQNLIAIGTNALLQATAGDNNIAIGTSALNGVVTGGNNVAVGASALAANTSGAENTAIGYLASSSNTTGSNNASFGRRALWGNTTTSNNVAIGYYALDDALTAGNNTVVGTLALTLATGGNNTALGYNAGGTTTTGTTNLFLGYQAGNLITTGGKNVVIGSYQGNSGGLDIRTSSNYIVLSDGDANIRQVIDSSGNVGIGAIPSAWGSGFRTIDIGQGTALTNANSTSDTWLSVNAYYTTQWLYKNSGVLASYYKQNNGVHSWHTAPSGTAGNAISFTQAMTLDASGNLLVGTTNASASAGSGLKVLPAGNGTNNPQIAIVTSASANTTASLSLYSTGAGAYRFYVADGGTVYATSTSISGISDASLKENVRDLETGLAEVMSLRPRRFDWKNSDEQNVAGFVAQEVEQVLPELVTDYQYSEGVTKKSLKMGDILPTLVKAIQEQQAIIQTLTARVAALEAA